MKEKRFFLLAAVVAGLLTQGCAAHKVTVRDAFVQVLKTVDVSACGTNAEKEAEVKCAQFLQLSGVGSGAVVWNERTFGGKPRTLVMTADHVCHDSRSQLTQDMIPKPMLDNFKRENGITGDLNFVANVNIQLKDSRGVVFNTKQQPWVRNVEADICIIESSINQRAIPIADREPEFGERVFNISAPYGLMFTGSDGGSVYNTEGNYSGNFSMRGGVRSMYTIWTAPGSSGSPVLNKRGEIVGVVSAISMVTWPRMNHPQIGVVSAPSNITFGPTLQQIRFSLNEAIAAMRREKPYVHNPKSLVGVEANVEGEHSETPENDSEKYLFPYLWEWR